MEKPTALEPRHHVQDVPIALAGRAHHELCGCSRGSRSVAQEPACQLERRQQIGAEVLVPGECLHVRVGRCLEVHRAAIGQARGGLDLGRLGAGQELDVQVTAEALARPENLERGQHAVGRPRRAPGYARGEEEAIDEPLPVRLHEAGRRLLGRERRAPHLAAAEDRAVAAGQRAGVGLHDAHERRAAPAGQANAHDANLVTDPGRRAEPCVPVEAGRLGEDGETLAAVHGTYYYTGDEW